MDVKKRLDVNCEAGNADAKHEWRSWKCKAMLDMLVLDENGNAGYVDAECQWRCQEMRMLHANGDAGNVHARCKC